MQYTPRDTALLGFSWEDWVLAEEVDAEELCDDETCLFELADSYVSDVIKLRQRFDRQNDEEQKISLDGFNNFIREVKEKMEDFRLKADASRHQLSRIETPSEDEEDRLSLERCALDYMIQAAGPRTAEFMRCFYITIHAQDYPGTLAHRRFQFEGTPTKIARGPLQILFPKTPGANRANTVDFLNHVAPSEPEQPMFTLNWEPIKMKEYEFRWLFLDSLVDTFGPYDEEVEDFSWNPVNYLFSTARVMMSRGTTSRDVQPLRASHSKCDRSDSRDEHRVRDNPVQQLEILRGMLSSFLKVDTDQYVFETIPAQILMLRTDQATWKQFLVQLGLSATCLSCLVFFTAWWNVEPSYFECLRLHPASLNCRCVPMYLCYSVFITCNVVELVMLISDLAFSRWESGWQNSRWEWQWLNFWNLLNMGLELFSICVVLLSVCPQVLHFQASLNPQNVWVLPALNATRWMKFTLLLLYLPGVGIRAMPSVLAAFSSQSCSIFSLILMAALACTHIYFGFRVLENGETLGYFGFWGIYTCFMRMSRALLFADGDVDHLAGRREAIVVEDNYTLIDEEDFGAWGEVGTFSKSIEFINIFTLLTLIFGVLLMNTYVGVLTDKYSAINAHRLHYFQAWRAQWQIHALSRRVLWARWCTAQIGQLKPVRSWQFGDTPYEKGLWIVSAPRDMDEVQVLGQHMEGILQDIKELKGMRQDISQIKSLFCNQH